jgi:methionyl-tRNA formyltransferase
MQPLNIVFIGASRFGLRCLELALRVPGCVVVGVVTAPQKFAISYRPEGVHNVLYADLASFAADRGLPSRTMTRSMSEPGLLEAVAEWKPDAFLVVGWYHMVPKAWRDLAPAYGLHASLLPDYSGGAPLVWAMINGETKTGITLFRMDDGVDTGPIVAQAEEVILPDDTIATLYARIEERGLELLAWSLPKIADRSIPLRAQSLAGRRVMPQRTPEDGLMDWSASSVYLDRFVRAQTRPYPGAFSRLGGARVTIWAAHRVDYEAGAHPVGTIFPYGDRVGVVCGDNALILDEVEIGGQVLAGRQMLTMLRPGAHFDGHEKGGNGS